jgi:phosphoribosylformimino-5-aminoimidazole carboxamide ribonucleotide (ProFAR) isomerase
LNIHGAVIGKALYEGKINVRELWIINLVRE